MSFVYDLFVKLLNPTSLALLLFVASLVLHRRKALRRVCQGLAIAVLVVCGNGAVSGSLIVQLESWHPAPQPLPAADAILVLSGGVKPRIAPRATVEVGEAGDRILYGAHLFRTGHAPRIICTGNEVPLGVDQRSTADEMAEFLTTLGVPAQAILTEGGSGNTHEHAVNLCPILSASGIRSVLLVTTAMHMPRSLGVFRHDCPAVTFIPAPTDYRITEQAPLSWYQQLVRFVPTPSNFVGFSDAAHEYVGMAYYRLRGWL